MADEGPDLPATFGGPGRAALPLDESARRIGRCRWIESRLFEVLGRWAPVVPEIGVKLELAPQSRHHGWHADLLFDLLPTVGDLTPEALSEPDGDGAHQLAAALAEPVAADQTIEKLAGVYRVVVPHLVSLYRDHLARAVPHTDGPVIRTLRIVLRDEVEAWQEGEALLRSLITTREGLDRALAHQARLEALLLGAAPTP